MGPSTNCVILSYSSAVRSIDSAAKFSRTRLLFLEDGVKPTEFNHFLRIAYEEPGSGMTWSPRLATHAMHSCAAEMPLCSATFVRPSRMLYFNSREGLVNRMWNKRRDSHLLRRTVRTGARTTAGFDTLGHETASEWRVSDHCDAELL